MRKAARLLGIVWMIAIALAGIVLVGSGLVRGNRAVITLLFAAALPGILAYRWGMQPTSAKASGPPVPRRRKAPPA